MSCEDLCQTLLIYVTYGRMITDDRSHIVYHSMNIHLTDISNREARVRLKGTLYIGGLYLRFNGADRIF